jgi:hypothetical protein
MIVQVEKLLNANKAKAAFLAPFLLALAGVVERYVETGVWDSVQTRIIVGGAMTAIAASVATYLTGAGKATVKTAGSAPATVDDGALDPILAGAPVTGPGTLQGDAGQPTAVAEDPRDQQIRDLRAQLAAVAPPVPGAPQPTAPV